MPFFMFRGMFTLMWLLVMGVFLFGAVRSLKEWNQNNHAPRLTVPAEVVNKRDEIHRRRANGHTHRSHRYYATFQVESGDRMEFRIEGRVSGILVEGDKGNLTFQGTRFLGFERTY